MTFRQDCATNAPVRLTNLVETSLHNPAHAEHRIHPQERNCPRRSKGSPRRNPGPEGAARACRAAIAALKRRTEALEKELRRRSKASAKAAPVAASEVSAKALRFSPKGLASQRRRPGLSADACGLLVGASGQSIYNWERGKARPRAAHLPAIAGLRTLGKKEAAGRLAALQRTP